jgi:hypothetical protein
MKDVYVESYNFLKTYCNLKPKIAKREMLAQALGFLESSYAHGLLSGSDEDKFKSMLVLAFDNYKKDECLAPLNKAIKDNQLESAMKILRSMIKESAPAKQKQYFFINVSDLNTELQGAYGAGRIVVVPVKQIGNSVECRISSDDDYKGKKVLVKKTALHAI